MGRPVAAAEMSDEQALARLVSAIDWSRRPAADFARAIRLALDVGAHRTARQLAAKGVKRFPDSAELATYAELLGPARVLTTDLPADPQVAAETEWLKGHGPEYRGQWVALRGGELLAAAPTLEELVAQIGNPKGRDILVTMVY
jgi:hypothetical protein